MFPFNPSARRKISDLQAGAGPSGRPPMVESTIGEQEGNSSVSNEDQWNVSPASSPLPPPNEDHAEDVGSHGEEGAGMSRRNLDLPPTADPTFNNEDYNDEGTGAVEESEPQETTQGNTEETLDPPQPLWDDLNPEERFALAVQKVKGSSNMSDAAVNKLLEVAVENIDTLRDFQGDRGTSLLYSRRLKPLAAQFIPKVKGGVLLEITHPNGIEYRHEQDLDAIPKAYHAEEGNLRVIRKEAYVLLQDIKRHHEGIHAEKGISRETLREHYRNCAMSVDGVQESHKGKKKFHVVSLCLGSCIYLYKIFNPLIGHPASDPSLGELLG